MIGGSGISRTICKSVAPSMMQTVTPAPHQAIFLQTGCSSWRPTNSVKAPNTILIYIHLFITVSYVSKLSKCFLLVAAQTAIKRVDVFNGRRTWSVQFCYRQFCEVDVEAVTERVVCRLMPSVHLSLHSRLCIHKHITQHRLS